MFIKDGQPFALQNGMIIDDVQIVLPLSDERMAELGITEVPDGPRPDDRFYLIGGQNLDGTYQSTPKELAELRASTVVKVKTIRMNALDKFLPSVGIGEVYAENLKAALAHASNEAATVRMRDGNTAAQYLLAMATGMGVTVDQFVTYVLAENVAAATKARKIEAEYLRVAYTVIPTANFEAIQSIPSGFETYCTNPPA